MSMNNGAVLTMAAENIATKHGKPYSRDVAQSVQLASSIKPAEGNASLSDQSDDHASRGGVEADSASLGGGKESGPTPDQATPPKLPAGPLAAESEKGTEADQSALTGTAPGSAPAPAGAAPSPNIPATRSMGMGSGETTSLGPTAAVETDRAQGSGSRTAEPPGGGASSPAARGGARSGVLARILGSSHRSFGQPWLAGDRRSSPSGCTSRGSLTLVLARSRACGRGTQGRKLEHLPARSARLSGGCERDRYGRADHRGLS